MAGSGRKSTLQLFPTDLILNWVSEDPTRRALFIASAAHPSMDRNGEGELTYKLLSQFGTIDGVKLELYRAFGHGGGWGPISEHYRKKQTQARQWLQEASSPHVQQWLEDYISSLQHNIERHEIEEERER